MPRSQAIDTCLVCYNEYCAEHGSVAIGEEIAAQLASAESDVGVTPYICFGACPDAPNIVLYPEGTWYSGAAQSDAQEIARHILGGPVVERLTGRVDPALQRLILEIIDSGLGQFEKLTNDEA
ncbi:MAG: sirohydrochlorin cobaltochelatase [Chloroflexota bacterium]|jgi:(2Fe-2S) ferredoxin|nr:sirohydrochlorin cobaltochelatase [Chloroflexota bacterium]